MQVTHDTLPAAVSQLIQEVANLRQLLTQEKPTEAENLWFDIYSLMNYLPDQPSKQTVYGWCSRREIPHHKRGKRLVFHKYEIDEWLKSGRRKTNAELSAEATHFTRKKA